MKRLLLLALLLSTPACATSQNAPQLTPQARTDHNLTPVVDGIGALQLAAENATTTLDNGKPILPVATARKIVQFCVDANTTLGTAGATWCATLGPAYRGMKHQLTTAEAQAMAPYFTTFEAVLATAGCTVQ